MAPTATSPARATSSNAPASACSIDCGEFQGSRELDEENARPFGFDPEAIDFVLLTHAHLDHVGRLALLSKRGFRGEVIATAATRELARLVMLDAAHIEEEDARHRQRRALRRGKEGDVPAPLYTWSMPSPPSIASGARSATAFRSTSPRASARPSSTPATSSARRPSLLELSEGDKRQRILFSGDLGNPGRPLLNPPAAAAGGRSGRHGIDLWRPPASTVPGFGRRIHRRGRGCVSRGGNILIPTFALERAQELLFLLREAIEQTRLNPSLQVFLDSPMAITATEIFRRHPESLKPEVAALIAAGRDPFAMPGLHLTRESAGLDGDQPDSAAAPSSWRARAWRPADASAITSSTISGGANAR